MRRTKEYYFFSFSDKSGRKNKITEAIPGKTNPIKNQILGFLPILLEKKYVMTGSIRRTESPKHINIAAPIMQSYWVLVHPLITKSINLVEF